MAEFASINKTHMRDDMLPQTTGKILKKGNEYVVLSSDLARML